MIFDISMILISTKRGFRPKNIPVFNNNIYLFKQRHFSISAGAAGH